VLFVERLEQQRLDDEEGMLDWAWRYRDHELEIEIELGKGAGIMR
jgi:hypothetical protein